MTEPRPQKHRKRRIPNFDKKPKLPKSWCTTPYPPEGQLDLDFENGDLPQEAVELFN